MRKINVNKKAFTLVEMVLVVAIILIIAAASLVGVGIYINNAKDSASSQEAASRNVNNALEDIKRFLRIGNMSELEGSEHTQATNDNQLIDPNLGGGGGGGATPAPATPTPTTPAPTAPPTQPTTAPTQAPTAGGNGGSGGTYSGSAMAGTRTDVWEGGANVCLGGDWQTPTIASVTVAAPAGTTFTGVGNVTDNGDGTYTFSGSTYNQYSFGIGYSTADGSQLNSSNFYVVGWQ